MALQQEDFHSEIVAMEKDTEEECKREKTRNLFEDYRAFKPASVLYGALPEPQSFSKLGYYDKTPLLSAGAQIKPLSKRKRKTPHLEYLYDENGKIVYIVEVYPGYFTGNAYLIEENKAVGFNAHDGKPDTIVIWNEESKAPFQLVISLSSGEVEKRVLRPDGGSLISYKTGPIFRTASIFRFSRGKLVRETECFKEEKKEDEIQSCFGLSKETIIEIKKLVDQATADLGQTPSDAEVGKAFEEMMSELPEKIKKTVK